MRRLVDRIADFYVAKNIIELEWRPLYVSGLKLIFSEVFNFLFILILGGLCSHLLDSILFLFIFCSVRGFSGGFHAKKHWICRATMIGTFLLILCAKHAAMLAWPLILPSIGGISLFIICRFSPIEHPNKYLSEEKKQKNRIRAIGISIIYLTISGVCLFLGRGEGMTVLLSLASVAVLMLVGKRVNEKNRIEMNIA